MIREHDLDSLCGNPHIDEYNYSSRNILSGIKQQNEERKELHIAPMLGITNTEFHHFFRILSKRCILWTEMINVRTISHADDLDGLLACDHEIDNDDMDIHPIICQLGGRDPEYISHATKVVEQYGYDECNINFGCPSSLVSEKRKFGAILMKETETAIAVVQSMLQHSSAPLRTMPISVKTRIGIDELDSIEFITSFISKMKDAGCTTFYIHARKCVLGGLTARQNRSIPPLNYPRVYAICRNFPDCKFIINGEINGLKAARLLCYGAGSDHPGSNGAEQNHMSCDKGVHEEEPTIGIHSVPCSICNFSNGSCIAPLNAPPPNLQGCMLGRAARDNPSIFWDVDRYFHGCQANPCQNRREVLDKYISFLDMVYPRRCCDDDDQITRRIPSPKICKSSLNRYTCNICQDYYGKADENEYDSDQHSPTAGRLKVRVTVGVIDRSIKPVLGLFFGLKNSKLWKRTCDKLSRDVTVRNCGPAYIIRRAMEAMPPEMLEENFVLTETIGLNERSPHKEMKALASSCPC